MKHVAVFASSSENLPARYREAALRTGAALARAGFYIVYGGGNNGLMGELARGASKAGGRLVGVIPRALREAGFCFEKADEIIVTESLAERKRIMSERAAAFVCLPGGLGTLDECFSALAEKQLGFHDKPVLLYDLDGFFQPLAGLIAGLARDGFIPDHNETLFRIVKTDGELIAALG